MLLQALSGGCQVLPLTLAWLYIVWGCWVDTGPGKT